MSIDDLLVLAKSKLNITWDDPITDTRVINIIEEAVPAVSNMAGLLYDHRAAVAKEPDGRVFDFREASMERNLLMNYIAYEWNHKTDLFREAYWNEIAACRQERAMETAGAQEGYNGGEDRE